MLSALWIAMLFVFAYVDIFGFYRADVLDAALAASGDHGTRGPPGLASLHRVDTRRALIDGAVSGQKRTFGTRTRVIMRP